MTLAKKHLRPPLTAVRRGHPAHAGLAIAVEEHHGKPGFLCGDLIEHIGVIHVGGLTGSGLLPLVLRVKGSVGGHGNAARRENSLLRDRKDRAVFLRGFFRRGFFRLHGSSRFLLRGCLCLRRCCGRLFSGAACQQGKAHCAAQQQRGKFMVVFHIRSPYQSNG